MCLMFAAEILITIVMISFIALNSFTSAKYIKMELLKIIILFIWLDLDI